MYPKLAELMNLKSNDAQVATFVPSLSLWKVYVVPANEPYSQMLAHFSGYGTFHEPSKAPIT